MPVIQSTFATAPAKGIVGNRVNMEEWNTISRVNQSATAIKFGAPVGRATGVDRGCVPMGDIPLTAVGAAGVPAPAAATITASPTVAAPAKIGVYTVTCIQAGGGTASKWEVRDPDGVYVGTATGTSAFTGGGLGFTVADPGTDPVVGERFTITVTATGGADIDFLGIAQADQTLNRDPGVFNQYDTVPIITDGVVWVMAGATVKQGQMARYNSATDRYTNAAKSATVFDLPLAEFDSDGADGDLVALRVKRIPGINPGL